MLCLIFAQDYCRWLIDVFDSLGISQAFTMVASSMSGWITHGAAIFAPERIKKIVLLDPAAVILIKTKGQECSSQQPYFSSNGIINEYARCYGIRRVRAGTLDYALPAFGSIAIPKEVYVPSFPVEILQKQE